VRDTDAVLPRKGWELGMDFIRLANGMAVLYPKHSEEKRLLDATLLAVPR
jgi:hypothetical protein